MHSHADKERDETILFFEFESPGARRQTTKDRGQMDCLNSRRFHEIKLPEASIQSCNSRVA
jgi:hypothetical protein